MKSTSLKKAVEYLKESKQLRANKDLMTLFSIKSEGHLSKILKEYPPNKDYVDKLEKAYNVKVSDFGVEDQASFQTKVFELILQEIAGIKASIKKTLAGDELNELKERVDRL